MLAHLVKERETTATQASISSRQNRHFQRASLPSQSTLVGKALGIFRPNHYFQRGPFVSLFDL